MLRARTVIRSHVSTRALATQAFNYQVPQNINQEPHHIQNWLVNYPLSKNFK